MPVYRLPRQLAFPDPAEADDSGLLAVGGDLSADRLLLAYRSGIFPWYEAGMPILWWSPDPRMILEPGALRVSRRLRRTLNKGPFTVRFDTAFPGVIRACAVARRKGQAGTWITPEMERAYIHLHELGYAHCIESWSDGELVGGLYGLHLGRAFCGESMFSNRPDASKAALVDLVGAREALGIDWIDCQVPSGHLKSLGAEEIPRAEYLRRLEEALRLPTERRRWAPGRCGEVPSHAPGGPRPLRRESREVDP
jgi:leucyl/phenylalanyl-tRNA--protein transferase